MACFADGVAGVHAGCATAAAYTAALSAAPAPTTTATTAAPPVAVAVAVGVGTEDVYRGGGSHRLPTAVVCVPCSVL